ncbi:unnamed protein product [Rotaria sordida]|uniref:F-box domain-containing protein n=1 Tax=Rotaria sordida TaxID=392033 RepID=A0A815HXQ8_9BILA|nr:unnamed protein product [Rotaria sordida]
MNSAESQMTSSSKQSRNSLDEHDLTNKRLKIDHADQNNQTHQFSTTKNQSTYVKAIQKNVFKKQSQFFIESLLTDQQQIDVKELPSSLETLPNELLVVIFSHLTLHDLVRTFYGLNCRFNSLVFASTRHCSLPYKTPLVCKIKLIRFASNNQQPITIDLLYLIENVFRSYNQTLQFNFWGLRLSDFCFGQLTSARALMPKLTNVTNLDLDSWDMSKLDAIIFVTWLKLVPNVRQLDMTSMDDSAKMILAKQLRQLVATDNRLMYILCRIQRVRIFTSTDKTDYPRQQLTYEIFAKIFPKAIVYRQ